MYKIKKWSVDTFADSREAWNKLLQQTEADQLFMSWEWQYSWWDKYGILNDLSLLLLAVHDMKGELVGIAPLFQSTVISKKILKSNRIQMIGNCWRGPVTMRTEKVDFIIRKDIHNDVLATIIDFLYKECDWDELVIPDLLADSSTSRYITTSDINYRTAELYNSYYLDLPEKFEDYLAALGKNTRLQVFNRRKKLAAQGNIELKHYNSDQIEECFDILNSLHIKRWGAPAFQNNRLEFNLTVARLFADKKQIHFIVLNVNEKPISIQYNYRVNNTEYNIQTGFDEDFNRQLRPGYLLFGYAIEDAIKDGIKTYDFLAGMGKNAQYKSRLTKQAQQVTDIQIFKSYRFSLLYKVYDFITK